MQDINELIKANTGLVKSQMNKLKLNNNPDAESIGFEALYNAILTYDVSKGYKLSTYATCCIYNALCCHIRILNRKKQLEVISYNNIAFVDDLGEHDFTGFFTDSTDASCEILNSELHNIVQRAYALSFNELTNDKQKAIVDIWHKSGYEMYNKDIAKRVGCSQPYVNQVINVFKFRLKKKLEGYYYD